VIQHGGIIVEVTSPSSDRPTVVDRAAEQPPEAPADVSQQGRPTAELRRLMDLADRYARRLVAAADAPPGVLLLVREGDLDVLALDGPDPDVRALPTCWRGVGHPRPSSWRRPRTRSGRRTAT